MRDQEGALEAAQQRRLAEIEQLVARDRALRELVTIGLPKIAAALHHTYGTVNYTQVGSDGGSGPLAAVPQAFAQLIALAKSFGLNLP